MAAPITFDRAARFVFAVALTAAVIWLIYYLREALLPFGVGCMIAYMAEPLVQWNMRRLHLRARVVPVLLTMFEIGAAIAGIIAIFLPQAIDDAHRTAALLHRYASGGTSLPFLPEGLHRYIHENLDLHSMGDLLHNSEVQGALTHALGFFTGGLDAIGSIVAWAVVVLYVLFILINYPTIMRGIRSIVPPAWRHISNPVIDNVSATMKRYFRTQALISAIAGVMFALGFWWAGLPMPAAWGLVCAVLFMVPYMVYLSLLPITLLCIVTALDGGAAAFWPLWLKCLATYAVTQSFSDLWLTPRIMSKSMNLDPAVILLSLSVWGTLLGFLGVILALPLTTIAIFYYRRYILGEPQAEAEE